MNTSNALVEFQSKDLRDGIFHKLQGNFIEKKNYYIRDIIHIMLTMI